MVVLIGYAVAMGCIFGAYIIHGGNIGVILHALPTELMAILGGSLGAFAVNNQPKVLKATLAAIPGVLKGSKYSKARYMELMALLYDILQKARKEGLMAIEKDVEDPAGSSLFQKYTVVGSDHHVVEFITDYLRMMVSGNLNAHEIESLMDSEIETHHAEAHGPVNALGRLAGALPAFGIVAAVLGVVNTMGSVGQPPAILGGMIGSALVGTFLGILLAYAVVEPLGGLIEQKVDEGSKELQCIKTTLLASMQGYAPQVAVEFGRKVLYSKDRPTFSELEGHVKGKKASTFASGRAAPARGRATGRHVRPDVPRATSLRRTHSLRPRAPRRAMDAGGASAWPVTRRSSSRSSSSASARADTASTAARGRSPMPTS